MTTPKELHLPTLARNMFADVETGEMRQYSTRQLEIVSSFAAGIRNHYRDQGKGEIVEYMNDKIEKILRVLRVRSDGEWLS